MRSKYKKKRSVEQQKKEHNSIEQNLNDLSALNHLKIISPEITTKNNLILNIKDTEICNDKKNIINLDKQNDIIKKNKRKNFSSKLIKDNNNNIQTVSNEIKNNENYTKKNNTKKYMLLLNKINKINNNNRNIRINKEKDISIKINKNIIKNKSQKNINENGDKINTMTNGTIANCISKRRIYEPLNHKYLKRDNNNLEREIIPIKTNSDLGYENNDKNNKYIVKINKDNGNNLKNENSKNNIKEKNSSVSADTKASTYSKDSLKYLIHQAHLIKELAPSFNNNNFQETKKIQYKLKTYDPNTENNFLNKNIYDKIYNYSINYNTNFFYNNKNMANLNILKTEILLEKDKNLRDTNYNKILYKNNDLNLNHNLINLEENKNKKRAKNKSSDEIIINKNNEKNIINKIEIKNNGENNRILVHKKNINIGKSLSEKKYNIIDSKSKNWSFLNIIPNNLVINNNNFDNNPKKLNLKNNKYSATFIDTIPNKNEFNGIDIEEFYNLELKFKNILIKLKNFQKCPNEYLDWITYYFNLKFFNKIIQIFKSENNKATISNFIKIEILSIFLGYNTFFHKNYNQISSYLISLFNLLNNNFLYLLIYIINNYNINNKMINNIFLNNIMINKINQLIINEKNLKIEKNNIQNEYNLISLIMDNYKEVNYYYKYIVEQIYLPTYNIILKETKFINNLKYNINNKNIFPFCLKIDKNKIVYHQVTGLISLFFYDSLKILNNYKFEDLFLFFEKYILISEDAHLFNYYKNNNIQNDNININSQFKYKDFCSINKNPNQYFLPPIKKGYKFTLVLDLDETLVFCRKDNNKNNIKIYNNINNNTFINSKTVIMRPGLLEFLHTMKEIYELVLFSLGTSDYVNSIVKIIEKKETFFDYILYRQHATYNDNYYIKDLSLLGRDLKKIIIVDDLPKSFKLHKKNGICIKPFYGDVVAERNTLKILGNILYKIRFDAEESGDIRKSLKIHRNLILKYITSNFECK